MTISFQCPDCAKPFNVDDKLAGKKARCGCGTVIRVPQPAAPAQQPAAPAPAQQPLVPQQPVDPLMGSLPPVQQPADPLMGSLPPVQQSQAPQQSFNPMAAMQQPSAAARGGGKGGKTAIMVAVGVGGVAVLGAVVWLVISMLVGGGDNHDKIVDDMIRVREEAAEVIKGIDTAEDAQNVKGDLERLNEEMHAIYERGRLIEKPDEETQQRLKAKLKEGESAVRAVLLNKMSTWKDSEILGILDSVLTDPEPVDWLEDDGDPGVEIDLSDPNAAQEFMDEMMEGGEDPPVQNPQP